MQRRIILTILAALLSAPLSHAQHSKDSGYPKIEIYGGWLDSGEFPYNVFRFGSAQGAFSIESDFGTHRGFETSFTRNFRRYFGLKGEFSAQFHHDAFSVNACVQTPCVPVVQPAELNPKLFNFLVGPEFKARNHTRFTPFAHALFGLAHTTATFETSGSAVNLALTTTETGYSVAFGGGLDIRIQRHWSIRTVVDYNAKSVGRDDNGARQLQQDLRLSTGILFHFR
jgi:opacity protein-like surface antigen